jgi:hypothetical protein
VEAAKIVPYRRLMLRAVQLSSEVYFSCGGEGLHCNVLYQLRPLSFQYPYRVKPLEILTSLCILLSKVTRAADRNRDLSPKILIFLPRKFSLPTCRNRPGPQPPATRATPPAPARPTMHRPFCHQHQSIDLFPPKKGR